MSAPLSVEGGRATQPGATLDARVAAVLGWRAWKEKRGEYSLCVVVAPGEREPWKKSRTPQPERYTPVTCELAATIGFFGTGFPKVSTDIAAAWLVVAWLFETRYCVNLFASHESGGWRCEIDFARFVGVADTAPLAICCAALAATERPEAAAVDRSRSYPDVAAALTTLPLAGPTP